MAPMIAAEKALAAQATIASPGPNCAAIWLACDALRLNARRHGVVLDVVNGTMPEVLDGLREADSVFLGGGGVAALEAALKVGHPRHVVAAFAAVERIGPALEVLDQQGFSTGGSQLASSRITTLPDGSHRLAATNPVFVVWGDRR